MTEMDEPLLDAGLKNAHRCVQHVDFLLADIHEAPERFKDVVKTKQVIINSLDEIFHRVLKQTKVFDEVIVPIFERQEETFLVDQEEVKDITSIRKLIASIYEELPSGHAAVAEIRKAEDYKDAVEKAVSIASDFHGTMSCIYDEISVYMDKIIEEYGSD
jgi:energy-converting hydrogenase A subunit M